ncbi:MAG: nonstructural protein [Microviridae sp.]|nr:MAG: nonstructural protein [Microviridae sp.]
MKLVVCAVHDKAVGAFLAPYFCRSKGEAIRAFTEACHDQGKPFGKNASDYTLYELGEYDDVGGVFQSHDPQRVLSALEVGSAAD